MQRPVDIDGSMAFCMNKTVNKLYAKHSYT
jgi:hypothetical protein